MLHSFVFKLLLILGITCSNPVFNDSLDVQGHERVSLLSVQFAVIKQDLLTAHNYIL